MITWEDLKPSFQNDTIPPGWFPGCGVQFREFMDRLKDWKVLAKYSDEAAKAVALRTRLKGVVKETVKNIVTEGPGADGCWDRMIDALKASYQERPDDVSTQTYDRFFDFRRDRSMDNRSYLAEFSNRLSEASVDIRINHVGKSYFLLKNARYTHEAKRWILQPVMGDLKQFDTIYQNALTLPDELSKGIFFADLDEHPDYSEIMLAWEEMANQGTTWADPWWKQGGYGSVYHGGDGSTRGPPSSSGASSTTGSQWEGKRQSDSNGRPRPCHTSRPRRIRTHDPCEDAGQIR